MKRRRKKGGDVPASEPRTTIEGGSIPPELVRLRDSRGAYHRFVEIESDSALARDVVKVERELGMPIELLKQIAEQLEVEVD